MWDKQSLKSLVLGAVATAKFIAARTSTTVDDAAAAALEATVNSPGFDQLLGLLFGSPATPDAPVPVPGPFVLSQPMTAQPTNTLFDKLPAGVSEEEIREKAREMGILPALIPVFLQLILKLLGVL